MQIDYRYYRLTNESLGINIKNVNSFAIKNSQLYHIIGGSVYIILGHYFIDGKIVNLYHDNMEYKFTLDKPIFLLGATYLSEESAVSFGTDICKGYNYTIKDKYAILEIYLIGKCCSFNKKRKKITYKLPSF